MAETRVASRYAKSLLDLSIEQKLVEEVYHDMKTFDILCEQSHDLLLFLRSPIIKHYRKQQILNILFKDRVKNITRSFISLTTGKGRARILHNISKEFLRQYLVLKGIQKAEVITTFELNDNLRTSFGKLVRQITNKKPELSEVVSQDIIGGYVLNIDDQRIDSSLKSRLKKIEFELNR